MVSVVLGILPERTGAASDESFFSFLSIVQRGYPFFATRCTRTDKQRNHLAAKLLNSDYSHVLMLDADHKHPPDIVERLSQRVIDDPTKLVVTALSFRRCHPYDPTAWFIDGSGGVFYHREVPKDIFEVDLIGGAAMLIHRSVFERVPWPWFAPDYEAGWYGEDLSFAVKCRAAGISLWVDPCVVSPHMSVSWVDLDVYHRVRELDNVSGGTTTQDDGRPVSAQVAIEATID